MRMPTEIPPRILHQVEMIAAAAKQDRLAIISTRDIQGNVVYVLGIADFPDGGTLADLIPLGHFVVPDSDPIAKQYMHPDEAPEFLS